MKFGYCLDELLTSFGMLNLFFIHAVVYADSSGNLLSLNPKASIFMLDMFGCAGF